MINRRNFLQGSGAFAGLSAMGLAGCSRRVTAPVAPLVTSTPAFPFYDAVGPIIPIRADMDRIFRITVCTGHFVPRGHGRMWNG
jgi:D-amino-acid oxidase